MKNTQTGELAQERNGYVLQTGSTEQKGAFNIIRNTVVVSMVDYGKYCNVKTKAAAEVIAKELGAAPDMLDALEFASTFLPTTNLRVVEAKIKIAITKATK